MPNPLRTPEGVRRLVAAAAAAPSVHNTQPWRFRVRDTGALELRADFDRRLETIDPRCRGLLISCGAALLNLRLAMQAAGHQPVVTTFPDEVGDPALLAVVQVGPARQPSPADHALYGAIARRRTNRYPFEPTPVPADVVGALITAARRERATLRPVDRDAVPGVLRVIRDAETELTAMDAYRAELDRWTGERPGHDGIPRYAFGPLPERGDLPMRDFAAGRAEDGRPVDRFERRPQLAVLLTTGDEPGDWLAAGQALQRVLLTATVQGLAVNPLTQPLDLRDARRLEDPYGSHEHVQAIVRIGYGPPAPGTPRRPYREILQPGAVR